MEHENSLKDVHQRLTLLDDKEVIINAKVDGNKEDEDLVATSVEVVVV